MIRLGPGERKTAMDAPKSAGQQPPSSRNEEPRPAAPERHIVVYAAANLAEAYHLKNILAEEGIAAEVTNSLLEGGSGVDIVGWPTLPRLLVREHDADRARRVALEYDRRNRPHGDEAEEEALLASAADPAQADHRDETVGTRGPSGAETGSPGKAEHAAEYALGGNRQNRPDGANQRDRQATGTPRRELPAWPVCPMCGRKRITQCPYCGACGSDFPLGDPPPHPLADDAADAAGQVCGCDRHGTDRPIEPFDRAGQGDPPAAIDVFAPAQSATGLGCGPGGCSPRGGPGAANDAANQSRTANDANGANDAANQSRTANDANDANDAATQSRTANGANDANQAPTANSENDANRAGSLRDEAAEMLVICPQCDEPFVPQFAEQCEWCDRHFTDGHPAPAFAGEVLNPSALWLIFGLIAVLAILLAWFAWVV